MPPNRCLIAIYFWINVVTDVFVWLIPFFHDPSKYVSQISSPVPDPPVPVLPAPYEPDTSLMTYVAHPLIFLAQPTTHIPTDYYVPKLESIPTQAIEPLCGPSVYFENVFDAIKSTDILCPKGTPFPECLFGGDGEFRKSLIEFITFYWGAFRKSLIEFDWEGYRATLIDYVSKVNVYYLFGAVFLIYFIWGLFYWQKATYPRGPLIPPNVLREPSADQYDSDNEEIYKEIPEAYDLQEESFWNMIKREFMQLMPKLQKPSNLEFIVPEAGNSDENPCSSNPSTTDNNNGGERPSCSNPPTADNVKDDERPSSSPPTTDKLNDPSSQQAPDEKHPSSPTLGTRATEIKNDKLNQEGPDDSHPPSLTKATRKLRRHVRRTKLHYLFKLPARTRDNDPGRFGTQEGPDASLPIFNTPPNLQIQALRNSNDADVALIASLSLRTKALVLQTASGNVQSSLTEL